MEIRKIMSLGKSSSVISIPKAWLRMNDLEKGDNVSLDIQPDGSLIIHPTIEEREKVNEIHLPIESNESEESIIRRIIASYLDGYNVIKLTSGKIFTSNQQRAIRKIVSVLYMMIIESEASSIILQTLIDESKTSVITSIERMHLITHYMCRDILRAIETWDAELLMSVIPLEDDIDQLTFFIMRLIRTAAISPSLGKRLNLDPLDCLDYQTLIQRIERIGDHNLSITTSLIILIESGISIPETIMNSIIRSARIAYSSYKASVEAFMTKDISQTNVIIEKQLEIDELYSAVTPIPHFEKEGETALLANIITIRESIKKISHYAADIAELTIDRAYKINEIK